MCNMLGAVWLDTETLHQGLCVQLCHVLKAQTCYFWEAPSLSRLLCCIDARHVACQ